MIRCPKAQVEVNMATQQSRARYPARITFQMSSELKAQLLEVAERDHEGDVQALGRQCLQARVERRGAGTDRLAEILDALERLPTEIAGRHLEQWERVNQLLEQGGRMFTVLNDDLTEMMAIRDELKKLVGRPAEQ